MKVQSLRRESGFTLIEFLMVALIISIISIVIAKLFFQSYDSFITSNTILEADWQSWSGIQRIGEDLHRIDSSTAFTSATSSALSFTDIDGNTVQYQLSGGTLQRNGQILASGIQGLSFSYLDESGASTSTLSAIRYVSVSVTASNEDITTSFSTLLGVRLL